MRERTAAEDDQARLAARVDLVQDLRCWIGQQPPPPEMPTARLQRWQAMQSAADLADKILDDLAHPDQGDKTLSVIDPDARCGKHGHYYTGYLLDVMIDADSQLVTALDVLPANGDEARNALELLAAEEAAHGNDVQQLSIDGIGFNGQVLRDLRAPGGVGVEVFTPPREFTSTEGFGSEQFELVEEGQRVRCPAGELSRQVSIVADKPNTRFYIFGHHQCAACELRQQCHPKAKATSRAGRRVSKNLYEAEYLAAREVAKSQEYAKVRREHPAVERKLCEFVRHHGARRARHRGRWRVQIQQLLTGTVINLKQMLKLLRQRREKTIAVAC